MNRQSFYRDRSSVCSCHRRNLLFARRHNGHFQNGSDVLLGMGKGKTRTWIQISTVADTVEFVRLCSRDALGYQDTDVKRHELSRGAWHHNPTRDRDPSYLGCQ